MDCKNQCCSKNERSFIQQVYVWFKLANIDLNRKVLAEMAVNDAEGFAKLAEVAKAKLA